MIAINMMLSQGSTRPRNLEYLPNTVRWHKMMNRNIDEKKSRMHVSNGNKKFVEHLASLLLSFVIVAVY